MAAITVLVVTYNAEKYIHGCLESVKWADEIVIVDMFSSDNTVKIARQYTDRIFQDKSNPGERHNIGIAKATSDWILIVFATERIPDDLRKEILQVTSLDNGYTGYYIPRLDYFWGKSIGGRPGPLHLFKRNFARYPCISGHETISITSGKIGRLKNFKIHWSALTIEELINKINKYTLQDARIVLAGHIHAFLWKKSVVRATIWNMLYRPVVGFFAIYFRRKLFRYKMHGFIFCVIYAFYHFLELAHLWELQYKQEHNIDDSSLPGD